ncbi:hypothetical protein CTEN210_03390 [Chaetoceros tenuissimus]|uniref:Uncharacterized protein n=1 Tax=Chaetoceros tenuissimus TaxID=426638 RepID=A0AAD3CJ97_9STRA|nr:hypothetical protein CTEN210_03390 [Chaetoceros tenuissimus]
MESKEYNAYHDIHLQYFFENVHIQKHLMRIGFIDSTGALINTSKNQRKLRIIENEFAYAKAEESDLRQEEETVRSIVRKKKFGKIQESRKFDKIMIMKQGKQNQRRIKAALNEFLIK